MWLNDGDQSSPSGNRPDIPMWAIVPDATGTDMTTPKLGKSRDESKPPDEMRLVSDLWAVGIPDFDSMSVEEPENIPFNKPVQYKVSNRSAPTKIPTINAIAKLKFILKPPRASGKGYRRAILNRNLETSIEDMLSLLHAFLAHGRWVKTSQYIAEIKGRGPYYGKLLRRWIHTFIANPKSLPTNDWGSGNVSRLDTEDGLREELRTHLQTIGKYVKAEDLVEYLSHDDTKTKYGATISISIATARRWMVKLDYLWMDTPSGQYVDGHKRPDVVEYRQNIFLPFWFAKEPQFRVWTKENMEEQATTFNKSADTLSTPNGKNADKPESATNHQRNTVVWVHDETVFYANDRRKRHWVSTAETAVPKPKGEGASLMVADFVSADYGWLRSPDGKESARVVIRPGAQRDGYFTNRDVLAQATVAMDIVQRHFPHDNHLFIFDNATTHLKRADTTLSARKMPLKTSKLGKNWLVETPSLDESGKQLYGPDGKKLVRKVRMAPGTLADGSLHSLYFHKDHEAAGLFKGMKVILEERGFSDRIRNLKQECASFHCPPGRTDCCIRRTLYSQPDFQGVTSLLEEHCRKRGFDVLFLPKFHPELSFVEQCWGRAKWSYRQLPPSSREEDLKRNSLKSLDLIPLPLMRR